MPRQIDDDDDRPHKRDDNDDGIQDRPPSGRKRRLDRDDGDDADSRSLGKVDRPTLRTIATYQRVILLMVLAYIGAVASQYFLPPELRPLIGLAIGIPVALCATVFVFLLSTKLYSTGVGVVLAILTLVPCLGLIMLLVINSKATNILRSHGVRVGLLGANSSDID